MRMVLTSVYVDDQAQALAFYTDVLGLTVFDDTCGNLIQIADAGDQ